LGIRGTKEHTARRARQQELVALFAADGMTLDPALIPSDTELSAYTLIREESLEKRVAVFWLGSISERTAQGGGISLSAPVTVKVKVSKEAPYRKYIGFGKNATYSPVPTTTQTIEAEAYDVSEQSSYYALDAGNPATFDQYGVEMSQKAKLEVALYTDDTFKIRLANGDDAWNRVKAGETKLQISNQLKKDVWCMVKTYVEAESTDAKTYGEQAKVHIVSQYPQAEKAVIKLTDGSGNPFSGDAAKGTFDIPGGSGRTTIKFAVDKFLDKNGGEMTSATAPTGYTVSAVAPSVEGVTVDNTNKTIEVTSAAVKSAPVEIEIKVTLADNTELTGILKVGTEELPAKITLKKGNSFATSLASYDSTGNSYAKGVIRADSHEGNALPTVLPGIGGMRRRWCLRRCMCWISTAR